jgi:hypothetical protein
MSARKADVGQSLADPVGAGTAVEPSPSGAEMASQRFAEEISRLPGVIRVARWGDEGAAPTFHVYVRPGDRETEYAIYELQGQVYDRFPEAYLEVVVLDALDTPPPTGETGA